MQLWFLEMLCSQAVTLEKIEVFQGLRGKKATDAVEDMFFMFLRNADTYLKVWMQKIYLEMFYSQTGTLDLSKTGIDKN